MVSIFFLGLKVLTFYKRTRWGVSTTYKTFISEFILTCVFSGVYAPIYFVKVRGSRHKVRPWSTENFTTTREICC